MSIFSNNISVNSLSFESFNCCQLTSFKHKDLGSWVPFIPKMMVWASYKERVNDTCGGDSGGPLVVQN